MKTPKVAPLQGAGHGEHLERGHRTINLGIDFEGGTKVTFKPDPTLFPDVNFVHETLVNRLRELAFLNAGVTITLEDERETGKSHRFHYDGGIVSFVEHLNRNKDVLHPEPIMIVGMGRMLEPEELFDALVYHFQPKKLAGRRVLLTAGPTFEPIDLSRLIENVAKAREDRGLNAGRVVKIDRENRPARVLGVPTGLFVRSRYADGSRSSGCRSVWGQLCTTRRLLM